jgi:HAD superfamily hydrolase (TIGR01509 family)
VTLQALLWDVDGTLAETERDGHRVAFNRAFEACGLPWRWDEARYGALLHVTGGRERLLHDMAQRSDAPPLVDEREALARRLHAIKNTIYAELVASAGIDLREGVAALIREARERGLRQAIVTTTSRANVAALLERAFGPAWSTLFEACICGEDVQRKKPDPQAYRLALQALGLAPLQTVAIEDSPGGAAAARAADVPVIVTRSAYFDDGVIEGAIAIGPGFGQRAGWQPAPVRRDAPGWIGLDDLVAWHHRMETVSQHG